MIANQLTKQINKHFRDAWIQELVFADLKKSSQTSLNLVHEISSMDRFHSFVDDMK